MISAVNCSTLRGSMCTSHRCWCACACACDCLCAHACLCLFVCVAVSGVYNVKKLRTEFHGVSVKLRWPLNEDNYFWLTSILLAFGKRLRSASWQTAQATKRWSSFSSESFKINVYVLVEACTYKNNRLKDGALGNTTGQSDHLEGGSTHV